MDHHTVAAVSIAGTCFDLLGSLYLAYDLLGGQHGPLRLITRAVTYSVVFGVGYGIGLGPFFGLAAGLATGITLSIEFNRAARGLDHYSLFWETLFSAIRGFGVGVGLYRILGFGFAVAFAILITVGQVFAYTRGMRPAMDYAASRRPRLTRRLFWGTVIRTVGYIATALICSAFIHHVNSCLVFCDSRRTGDGNRHRCGSNDQSLYRILCGQPAGAAAWGIRHWTHPLRFCTAVSSVLAGVTGCAADLGSGFTQNQNLKDHTEDGEPA